ncbi:MAG: SMC-Scp complex subunit ScpB [Treponema sp.]|jgi:segregation and condensation protein B|nr:SMC-Scp complex subunit ScpB [Treponema sp.]
MEISLKKETALVEAILYLEADPLDEAVVSRISGLSKDVIAKALENLDERYNREDSGVELSRIGGGVMISPKKEYWDNLRERYGKKNESKLSKAALETLSIIAYKQPITRSEIEQIRGVQADTMIRLLLEKNLIRETGKKDAPGRPIQYGTTRDFLKFFRLESIADLPKLNEMESDRFELTGDE